MKIKEKDEQHIVIPGVSAHIIIDKPSQTVTVRQRFLFWNRRERFIPFSAVTGVTMDQKLHSSSPDHPLGNETWKVSIDIGGKKLKIDEGSNSTNMLELAEKISLLMDKKLTRSYVGGNVNPFLRRD